MKKTGGNSRLQAGEIHNDIKSLINENILNPLIEKKIKKEKELEIQQQAIYIEIKSRLNQHNYTPHNHFKEINKWNEKEFDNFINKFNKNEISKFKELLLDCAKDYEDKSVAGQKMNMTFDNIASEHRNMFYKIDNNFHQESSNKVNNKFKI